MPALTVTCCQLPHFLLSYDISNARLKLVRPSDFEVMACRHAACIDMVQQKNGPDAAAILRAMLHATQSYETESKASHQDVYCCP